MNHKSLRILILALGILVIGIWIGTRAAFAAPSLASVGTAFTYQGYIEDSGAPANGSYNLRFSLYDDPTSGSLVSGPITKSAVAVVDGLFSVTLDFGSAFDGTALWLLIEVQGSGDPGYTLLSPRQPLTPVPYAINADRLDGLDAAAFAAFVHNHVGESWSTTGISALSLTSSNTAGRGLVASSTASTGAGRGVEGYAYASGGRGLSGINNATSGSAVGTYGETSSSSGFGVFGFSTVGAGVGGQSQATNGTGVYGTATGSGSSTGVYGSSDGTQGQGVSGFASSSTGFARGVYGYSASSSGFGVYGFTPSTGGHGVGGESQASGGRGVYGNAYRSAGTGVNYGVYGRSNSSGGYGGFFVNDDSTGQGYLLAANDSMSTSELEFTVSNNGDVRADGNYYGAGYNTGGADLAEMVSSGDASLEAGDVLVIGADGIFIRSDRPFQASVVGIYSTQPGFVGGVEVDDSGELIESNKIPLAIVGIVPVKAITENGAIQPGDLLVSSSLPGYAMAAGETPPVGTVIGKALEPLEEGTGLIQMLVMAQ